MNNKIKKILERANLDFKKELVFILIINIIFISGMVVVFLFTGNNLFFIPFIFLIVLLNAVAFYRYLFLYSKNATDQIREFVTLFRYLYIDINNQIKVKDALKSLKERGSLKMGEKLEQLFNETKQDESLTPYLRFASTFSSVLIEEVMINLYRFSQKPHKENLAHFNEAYLKLKKVVEEDEEKDINRQYGFIKVTAIIGTAIIVILVIIVTIIITEEYIHG